MELEIRGICGEMMRENEERDECEMTRVQVVVVRKM